MPDGGAYLSEITPCRVGRQGPDQSDHATDVLEAHARLIVDAMGSDHARFTTGDGIDYAQGQLGLDAIRQLIAPHAWRLPFERAWRDHRPWPAGHDPGIRGICRAARGCPSRRSSRQLASPTGTPALATTWVTGTA